MPKASKLDHSRYNRITLSNRLLHVSSQSVNIYRLIYEDEKTHQIFASILTSNIAFLDNDIIVKIILFRRNLYKKYISVFMMNNELNLFLQENFQLQAVPRIGFDSR